MALIHNDSNGLFLVDKTMRYFTQKGVHAAVALFAAPLMLLLMMLMCVSVAISSSHAWAGEEVGGAANANADVPVKSLPSGGPRLAEGGGIHLVPIDEPADLWEAFAGGKIN